MTLSRLPAIPAFLLGLALSACNPTDHEAPTAAPEIAGGTKPVEATAMDREITMLKSRISDPAELDTKYRAILSRHGYAASSPLPQTPMGPVSSSVQDPAAEAALAKSAAVSAWKTVKEFDFGTAFAFYHSAWVAENATISVFANRVASPTDPVLVAYYQTSGASVSTAYTIQAVAFNDDRATDNRNAFITWKNTTGRPLNLEIMAFAYSSATTGKMNITVLQPNNGKLFSVPVSAYPVYVNSKGPFANCTGPQASRIQLKRLTGGSYLSGLLAFNYGTARGGFIWETGSDIQTLNLEDVLPSGNRNFLLGVMLDTDEPFYDATWFTGIQQDKYTCTLQPGGL